MRRNVKLLLAALAGSLLLAYVGLVSPRRVLRCLPAIGRYLTRSYGAQERAGLPEPAAGNRVELLVNGDEALPALLERIDGAFVNIRAQVMLFFPDEAGMSLARALARAARRGVQVQLSFNIDQTVNGTLADVYPREKKERLNRQMERMLAELREAGVEVRANPAGVDFPLKNVSPAARAIQQGIAEHACVGANHYDHRKLWIVDDRAAVVGGMNVGNTYLYRTPPDPLADMVSEAARRAAEGKPEAWEKWFDAVLLVEGPVVSALVDEFNWRWEVLGGQPLPSSGLVGPREVEDGAAVRFLVQRPGTPQVGAAFFQLVRGAEREIWVASPYVSYEPALRALQAAAERGVRVVFVFPYGRQEMPIAARLMRAAAPELVRAGVELYFNDRRMAHTKLMVVDGRYTLAGSFNLNHRSFRHDLETAVLVDDPALAQAVVARVFDPYLQISRRVTDLQPPPWSLLDWIVKPFS